MKNVNVCCTQFESNTYGCNHPQAPSDGIFFKRKAKCIETMLLYIDDPRVISKCKIRVPFERPAMPPKAP